MQLETAALTLNHHDGTPALQDISLRIAPGRFCAVLGTSGAGKTSLLRVLGGLQAPSTGVVRLDGQDLCAAASVPALRPRIGQVHQALALVRQSGSAANIMAGAAGQLPFWRALTGLYPAWARQRAVRLHLALGLDASALARPVSTLSGGQQQRVAMARALMARPDLLLADEPVSSLDPVTARMVLDFLKVQARETGMTVVCALHQGDLARAYADQIIVLDRGRVVFDGPAADYRPAPVAGLAA